MRPILVPFRSRHHKINLQRRKENTLQAIRRSVAARPILVNLLYALFHVLLPEKLREKLSSLLNSAFDAIYHTEKGGTLPQKDAQWVVDEMRDHLPRETNHRVRSWLQQRKEDTVKAIRRSLAARPILITILYTLFHVILPEKLREKLSSLLNSAFDAIHHTEKGGVLPEKDAEWIVDEMRDGLPREANHRVRSWLLQLAMRMDEDPFPSVLSTVPTLRRAALAILEQPELTRDEMVKCIELLEMFSDPDDPDEDTLFHERVVRMVVKLIADRYEHMAHSEDEMDKVLGCLYVSLCETPENHRILWETIVNDGQTMAYLFKNIRTATDGKKEFLVELLAHICAMEDWPGNEGGTVLFIVRYYEQLKATLPFISPDGLWSLIDGPIVGIASLLSTMPCQLERMLDAIDDDFQSSEACHVICAALKAALQSRVVLEDLLSRGCLEVAKYICEVHAHDFGATATFASILAMHPEYKGAFKKLTAGGWGGNPTTILGISIIIRPRAEPIDYIFDGFDDDVFL